MITASGTMGLMSVLYPQVDKDHSLAIINGMPDIPDQHLSDTEQPWTITTVCLHCTTEPTQSHAMMEMIFACMACFAELVAFLKDMKSDEGIILKLTDIAQLS